MTPTEKLYHEKRSEYFETLKMLSKDLEAHINLWEAHHSCPYTTTLMNTMDDVRLLEKEPK